MQALAEGERRAGVVLAFDEAVTAVVARLKERGFDCPYLRNFVVARGNPLRFMKGEPPPFDDLLAQMTRRVKGMDLAKVKSEDVARTGGAPEGSDPGAEPDRGQPPGNVAWREA